MEKEMNKYAFFTMIYLLGFIIFMIVAAIIMAARPLPGIERDAPLIFITVSGAFAHIAWAILCFYRMSAFYKKWQHAKRKLERARQRQKSLSTRRRHVN